MPSRHGPGARCDDGDMAGRSVRSCGTAALLVLLLAACSDSSSPPAESPPADRRAALGANFTLAVGESARIDGTDLVVTFTRVVEDSRCPTGVTCVRQGEVRIAVTVRGAGAPATLELEVPPTQSVVGRADGAANEKRVGEFLVHLESVDPSPTRAAATAQVALRATLRVKPVKP